MKFLSFLISLVFLLFFTTSSTIAQISTNPAAIGGKWGPLSVYPIATALAGMACGVFNGTNSAFVLGGIDSTSLATSESFWYNFTSASWERLRDNGLPATSYGNVGILQSTEYEYDQKLIALNGYSLENGFNRDTAVYDPVKRTWSLITIQDAPPARRGAGSWFYEDRIFLFGGATENAFDNNVYTLNDIFTKFPYWDTEYFNNDNGGANGTTFGTAPSPRFGQCCAHVYLSSVHYGYCFGGTTAVGDSNEMWVYDDLGYTWTKEPATGTPPSGRRDASCAYIESAGLFIVYGGFHSAVGGTIQDRTMYIYDVHTKDWSTFTQPAISAGGIPALSQAPMCAFGNETLLVGGLNAAGGYEGSAHLANATSQVLTRVAPALSSTPAARHFHNSIAIGDTIYIMFGADDYKAYNDIWKYNTTSEAWTKLHLSPADEDTVGTLPARFGATLVSTGTTLYIFGGASWPEFNPVSEMIVIELTSLEYRIVSQSGTIPVRLNHVMLRFGDRLVVGTGITTTLSYAPNWFVFDIQAQKWTRLSTTNEVRFRYGMSASQVNDTHGLIGLGYGSQSYFEWYYVTMPSATSILFTRQAPKLTLDSERRRVIRMFATAVVSGSQVVICGGQIDSETPPARATICYHWNIATNTIFPIYDLPIPVSGATADLVGSKMYVFGGRKTTSAQLLDEYSDAMQVYQFNTSKLCSFGTTNDTHCLFCGPGTVNPNCEPVLEGQYLSGNSQTPVDCPAGTFLPIKGASSAAFCLKCPAGSFSDTSGAAECRLCTDGFVCPMGSTNPLGLSSGYAAYLTELKNSDNLTLTESNPAPYVTPSIPWFPVLLVACTTVVLALGLGIFVGINRYVWKSRIDYFIPQDVHDKLEKIYLTHATHVAGMSESNFIEACHHIDFPHHKAHAIELQKLFFELDSNGTNALGLEGFLKSVILMVERGAMNPLEGSDCEKELAADSNNKKKPEFKTWVPASVRDMEMSNFDQFSDSHRSGQPGDEIRNQQTWGGGFLALVYYVAIVILILAIVINFAYSNILETKAAVPRAVIQSSFGDNTIATPHHFAARVAVVGPLHGKTISQLREVCINNNVQGKCNGHTTVTISGVQYSTSQQTKSCYFNEETEECEIEWSCQNCYIPSKATILFEPSPYHSGDAIRARVYSTTGIRNPVVAWSGRLELTGGPLVPSWVERRITPADNKTVFTGSPPTVFGFGVTPTFVEANEVIHNFNPTIPYYLSSGYHVRPDGSPVEGNAVEYDAFDRFHGVPIQVDVTTDVTPLFVRRVFIQSSVQLIVSLLGAISGLGGGILAAVQFSDGFFIVNENSQKARDDELVEKEGVQALYDKLPKVKDEDVDDLLYLIDKGGYEANVAKELLDMINENCTSTKSL